MNKPILSPATVTERKSQPTCQSGYTAPRIFPAGSAVEVIQGNLGPWADADNRWCKGHK